MLQDIIGTDYDGPIGVDMMTLTDGRIDPAVELNLRMTMGHLCLRLYDRYIAPGAEGTFAVNPAGPAAAGADVFNGRLHYGAIDLNPPGSDFRFVVNINK